MSSCGDYNTDGSVRARAAAVARPLTLRPGARSKAVFTNMVIQSGGSKDTIAWQAVQQQPITCNEHAVIGGPQHVEIQVSTS